MKLYELPKNTRFTLNDDESKTVFLLDKFYEDYAECFIGDAPVHLSSLADIEVVR
jgi:hypothetical protein